MRHCSVVTSVWRKFSSIPIKNRTPSDIRPSDRNRRGKSRDNKTAIELFRHGTEALMLQLSITKQAIAALLASLRPRATVDTMTEPQSIKLERRNWVESVDEIVATMGILRSDTRYPCVSPTRLSMNHFLFAPDPQAMWCEGGGQQ